jgi:hypothetical protein
MPDRHACPRLASVTVTLGAPIVRDGGPVAA